MRIIKFPTILGLGILVAGLVGVVVLVSRQQQLASKASSAAPIPERVTISNISDRSFSVSWVTSTPTSGYLLVGKSGQSLSQRVADDRDKQTGSLGLNLTHYVTVDNLEAGSQYSFRLGEGTTATFDQNGSPYSVTMAPALSDSSPPDTAQGVVMEKANTPAGGAIVYAQLPGVQIMSALVSSSGNWVIPLSTARKVDLTGWSQYDRSATIYNLHVDAGATGQADATLTTAIDRPVPPIFLNQTYDFRKSREPVSMALAPTGIPTIVGSQSQDLSGPVSGFNFNSLGDATGPMTSVTLENPANEGELINTYRPEFFGKGPKGTEIEVVIESPVTINANSIVSDAGSWTFSPSRSLTPGNHKITVNWVDSQGILQSITRSFVVSASEGPAFTSTPSATPTTGLSPIPTIGGLSPTPRITLTPTPKPTVPPRTSNPPNNGTPKSGSLTPGAVLFMMGIVFIIAGMTFWRRGEQYGR